MSTNSQMKVLVTGAEGFVARYLLPFLRAEGAAVVGTALAPHAGTRAEWPVTLLDIRDASRVRAVVREVAPSHIVHLAAVTSVQESFVHPELTEDVNVRGTAILLEAAAEMSPRPVVLLIGSGDEYGPNRGDPLPELPVSALAPVSPYGKSKTVIEELVERESTYRAMTIRTRSFAHIGPGQTGTFFVPEVASHISRIERGEESPVIGVGNLTAVRDFTDVRDVVRAYGLLLEKGQRGEVYNVCSGTAVSIRDLLDMLVALAGVAVRIEVDPRKVRPADIPILIGDGTKLRRATGWVPEISLRETLRAVLEHARRRIPQ